MDELAKIFYKSIRMYKRAGIAAFILVNMDGNNMEKGYAKKLRQIADILDKIEDDLIPF